MSYNEKRDTSEAMDWCDIGGHEKEGNCMKVGYMFNVKQLSFLLSTDKRHSFTSEAIKNKILFI